MQGFFSKIFGRQKPIDPIFIVSGLPRSGTSMMMKMLEAGGIDPVTDLLRTADEDNPKGYYEFERVKQLDKGDSAWMTDAPGKVVKVISALLKHLPAEHTYRVIFMRRPLDEIWQSQSKMLTNMGKPVNGAAETQMKKMFDKNVREALKWMYSQENVSYIEIDYVQTMSDPSETIAKLDAFIERPLDLQAMAAVVDPQLYRNRVG